MIDLRAENLSLAYDGNAVIRELSATFPPQQITALIGPNGSGKSTLLKGLARLMKPQGGAVYLDGQAIHRLPTREVARRLAILPQRAEAPDGLTVRELVAFGRFPHQGFLGIFSPEDEAKIDLALAVTGMSDLAQEPLGELSGGQRQLAWIAMALAQDTPLLLLDEPTTFLDMAHQLDVLEVLERLHRQQQRTIVMVLHDVNQAARYAHQMIALVDGCVVCRGTPQEVLTPPWLARVRHRGRGDRRPADAGAVLYSLCGALRSSLKEKGMRSAAELKQIFQEGWNIPARVDNYVRTVAGGEFGEGATAHAWRAALETALSAAGRLRVLDVGTGPGVFACLYAQMGHETVGLDFSRRMLAAARQHAAELAVHCEFVFGDAEAPPFPADAFDCVSTRHLLFNLPRPGVAVRQWTRLLKPGGRMILIGDDSADRPASSLAGHLRRVLGHSLLRLSLPRTRGWSAGRDYLKAVSECPLFRHGAGALRAVMEAAGLEDIRTLPTDGIYSARLKMFPLARRWSWPPGRPFILVGIKP